MAGFKIVIPARYASSRLPGKPLLQIAGKAMILHVCDRAREAKAEQVIVATDCDEIAECVEGYGVTAVMTRPDHSNGTERIAEVCEVLGWQDSDLVVNLQGDEPLVPAAVIRSLASALDHCDTACVATLATEISDGAELFNPNAVKVVLDRDGHALYFSRATIPWDRDGFAGDAQAGLVAGGHKRHIGMYAYSVEFLRRYREWPVTGLERMESLEQLRILWNGERVLVVTVDSAPEAGVDTAEDLVRVEGVLRNRMGPGVQA